MMILSLDLAAAFYLAVAILGRSRRDHWIARFSGALLGLGVGMHAVHFYLLHSGPATISLESFVAALSLIAWLIVVAYLVTERFARVQAVRPWVAAVAAAVTLIATLGLRSSLGTPAPNPSGGVWSHAHVLLSATAFSFLAISSVVGFAYLLKEFRLKHHGLSSTLPALETLDRVVHLSLALGFALLTLGVATGFAWARSQDLAPWTAHTLWLLGAWAVYCVPVTLSWIRQQHGVAPARGVVFGFLVLAFSYVGIRLISGGA